MEIAESCGVVFKYDLDTAMQKVGKGFARLRELEQSGLEDDVRRAIILRIARPLFERVET